eukprot:CAMPEP_0184980736 /NCGR_PEP_ID=MMETSP1098-20130426/10644_1 /TAXON_ID=89044 /ORGANISM="Spumella elongata, Strain CCAP 955/1" /LENGTH=755 /DNA_ID=CAMNT_0027504213 /DNA_START=39 /DNA_END=2306 /DNA_ORIENTATION=+
MTDAAVKLPTRLIARDGSTQDATSSANAAGSFSLFSSRDKKPGVSSSSVTQAASVSTAVASAPIQVAPDDIFFEAALAGPTQRSIQAAQSQARRKVPLKVNTEAALGVGEEGLRRSLTQNEEIVAPIETTETVGANGNKGSNSLHGGDGETNFRKVLGQTSTVSEVLALLHLVQDTSDAVLHTLSDDLHANFPSLHEYMCTKNDAVVTAQNIPSALLGLGVRKHVLGVSGVKSAFKDPTMVSSGDCLEYTLGANYTIEALVAFIQRAETPVNVALSDPAFRHNIHNVAQLKKFKIAAAAVINSAGDSTARHLNLRRVVELSHTLSKEEQSALKSVVRGSTLPSLHFETGTSTGKDETVTTTRSKTAISTTSTVGEGRSTSDAAASVAAPPGMHKSASMKRFKASAEVIKLMLDSAAPGGNPQDSSNITASDPSAAATGATSGESIPLEDRARVHRVLNALAKGNNDKGVAGLFKKLNLQMNNSASNATLGDKADPSGDGRTLSKDDAGVNNTNSTASLLAAVSTDSAAASDQGLGGIKSMMDMMFQEKDSDPHPRKAMKAASSFLSLLNASKSSTNSMENMNQRSASSVQAEAEAFYRAPVAAPLSRFHEEKVKQNSPQRIRFADSLGDLRTNRQRSVSSDGEEEVQLSSHATQSAHHTAVPARVRVFETASQHVNQHVSMLHLLRQAMTEEESNGSGPGAAQVDHFPPRQEPFFRANGGGRSDKPEPVIEKGGMLDSLRSRPKPDYQQPRDVYF